MYIQTFMSGLELSNETENIVNFFDMECERFLKFDILYNNKLLTKYLDELIENNKEWDKIAVACRRMIICDRELDLEKGIELINRTIEDFLSLKNTYEEQPYESIRYVNTCGLISYRSGNYYMANKYFIQAKEMAEKFQNMMFFIPDTTSNLIRTDFELIIQVMPEKIDDYIIKYKKYFIDFINGYIRAIEDSPKYKPDNKTGTQYLIYGHGMASLYHNLGETYSKALKIIKNIEYDQIKLSEDDLKEREEMANECSLKWGEKISDEYRQLQSKNALSKLSKLDEKKKKEYENDVLKGKWQRGRQFIYQLRIANSKDVDDVEFWTQKDDFKLDIADNDKFVLLYNYNSIKNFLLKKGVKSVKINGDNELDILKITEAKIQVAEKLRNIYSPILYKRQVIHLIREDISIKLYNLLDSEKYIEALNFNEKYNSRSITELSELIISGKLNPSEFQNKQITNIKNSIHKPIESISDPIEMGSSNMSTIIDEETNEKYLNLIFAYEEVLKKDVDKSFVPEMIDGDVFNKIINKLKNKENTVILKFLVTEFKQNDKQKSFVWCLLINEDGIKDAIKLDLNFVNVQAAIKKLEEKCDGEDKRDYTPLHIEMAKLANKLELFNKFKDIKNLFIIPDGELFQFPLHLLDKDGKDLRKKINVYYSPSLSQLLKTNAENFANKIEKSNYFWVQSPTKDLWLWGKPYLHEPNAENIITLEGEKATLDSFYKYYKENKFTHIGFSTHCEFHDHLIAAYVSNIKFHDSFLTPYDILFYLKFDNVQTIFLGACSGGSCKYTDENEAVGLVTAFLAKNARSVIAPIWDISKDLHNCFIKLINESDFVTSPHLWNLSKILKESNEIEQDYLIPFIQYGNLELLD